MASMSVGRSRHGSGSTGEPLVSLAAVVLAALGAWTIVIPYVGHDIGLSVDVASSVGVVDHVVPGAVVAVISSYLILLARQRPLLGRWPALLGGGVCFLAGFWVLATHAPLMIDAARGKAGWGATIWHTSTSLPIVGLSLWLLTRRPSAGVHGHSVHRSP